MKKSLPDLCLEILMQVETQPNHFNKSTLTQI